MKLGLILLIALAALGMGPGRGDCGEAKLKLRAEATVNGETVTVGDVAVIEAEPGLEARLRQVAIGPSPLAGDARIITAGYVKLHLRRAGMDMAEVQVEGDAVRVLREECGGQAGTFAHDRHAARSPHTTPAEPVLKRGEAVEIVVRAGAITIRAAGRVVEETTREGLTVVRVDQTNALVKAKITGQGSCEVIQ